MSERDDVRNPGADDFPFVDELRNPSGGGGGGASERGQIRRLAEEIRYIVEQRWIGRSDHDRSLIESRLRAFLAEREREQVPWAPREAAEIIEDLMSAAPRTHELLCRAREFAASCRRVRTREAAGKPSLTREGSEG